MIDTLEPVQTIDPEREWQTLMQLHDRMGVLLEQPDTQLFAVQPAVSQWSTAGHIYHLSTSNFGIARLIPRLIEGHLPASQSPVNFDGIAILLSGELPRGYQAPERMIPPADLDRETVVRRLETARQHIASIEGILPVVGAADARFDHPYLGPLNPAQWLRFMNCHTLHHLRIAARAAAQH